MSPIHRLQENIELYTRKYYMRKVLIGAFLFSGATLAMILVFAVAEHLMRLGKAPRAVLFYGFICIALGLLFILVLAPLLRRWGLIGRLTDGQAAVEIGQKLPAVDDQLTNTLFLAREEANGNALIHASLTQRAAALSEFDFSSIIDLKDSLRWLKYTLSPLLVLFLIAVWDPTILTQSTLRLVHYNESFTPPAPFEFVLTNDRLEVREGDPFTLTVKTRGSALPERVFIEVDGTSFRMKSEAPETFSYTFSSVRNDVPFTLRGGSVYSSPWVLRMLHQPKVLRSEATLTFPEYIGRSSESVLNRTKIMVPEGTTIDWRFLLKDVEDPQVMIGDGLVETRPSKEAIQIRHRFLSSSLLLLDMRSISGLSDSAVVEVLVVKDAFPSIESDMSLDSLNRVFYFRGKLADDYGCSKFQFVAESENGQARRVEEIAVNAELLEQGFSFAWSPDSMIQKPGDAVKYYFELWDNDGVNGPKRTSTQVWRYAAPTKEELSSANKEQFDETKKALKNEERKLDEIKEKLKDSRKELLEKKDANWEDKEALKELIEQQQQMMESLQERAIEQKAQQEQSNKFSQYSEQLMEKQRKIQEMFDELFDEAFKEKYREYQELLEQLTKEEMLERLDEMELDNEKLEKELDRTLELFKQLEFEQNLEDRISDLEDMIERQESLKEETEKGAQKDEDLAEDQAQLKEDLEQLEESLEELNEMNQSLEEEHEMPGLDQQMEEAQEGMDQAEQSLQKSQEKKAAEQQQKAQEKMEEMKSALSSLQQQMAQDQHTENMEHMRQLLENIVDLSLDQERVMEEIKPLRANDPKYVEFSKRQKDLIDDTKVVEDSLLALSKRVPEISKQLNDQIADVKYGMEKALKNLTEQPPGEEHKYKAMAAERQQLAMTSLNDLALLFDEIIRNMQQQMNAQMNGSGQCTKPGQNPGSKPSAGDMRKMQESLNKRLEDLKKAMEKGQNPNGKKPGEGQGMGPGGSSKELARMAAEQAAIRKQLREMSESLSNDANGGSAKEMKELERMMEETEEDILYRKIDQETMRRQQEIITKLLESEKAERERELEQKRESKGADQRHEIPVEVWEEFEKRRSEELELYQTLPPNLKPFFRKEVNRYFSTIQE